jgi:hypothetical protein
VRGKKRPKGPGGKKANPAADRPADQSEKAGNPVEHRRLLSGGENKGIPFLHICARSPKYNNGKGYFGPKGTRATRDSPK